MKKAIFYKEWIKTRRYFPIALTVSVIFIIYALLGVQRVINFRGVAHLWEILLSRDVVFIETLTYIPLLAGLLLAIVQFVPEMQQKRLKLTLHLPYPQNRMLMLMLIAGLSELIVIYLIDYLILYVYLQNILAPELTDRILLTSLPWYLAGLALYPLAAWVCREPTWRRRVADILVAVGVCRLFFLSETPQAYDGMLPWLLALLLCVLFFPLLSVYRFKQGCQD